MSLDEVVDVVSRLRDPVSGCPWDLKQSHQSLAKYLIEESNEVLEVIENLETSNDFENLKDELGDVLFQVLIHSQLANEAGKFNIDDVIDNLKEKLIRRHPHVFGDSDVKTVEESIVSLKKETRGANAYNKSIDETNELLTKDYNYTKYIENIHQFYEVYA